MNKSSFTSASVFPIKIFTNEGLIDKITEGYIYPIHLQINPTNKCPFDCSFCSCKNRNKNEELEIKKLKNFIKKSYELGSRAITITGGGDPLAYKNIQELIDFCKEMNMDIGLVTNGILFNKVKNLQHLTWCRISYSDESSLPLETLKDYVKNFDIDWSFSYVITEAFKTNNLIKIINFSNTHNFTHVRLVDDILKDELESKMSSIKQELEDRGVDDSLVIYQGRKKYTRGHKRCLISLLKPNIDASGYIIPCCGYQYSKNPPILKYSQEDSMGSIEDIEKIIKEQRYFDGSQCEKCYYSEYNKILNQFYENKKNIIHNKFI